MAVEAAKPADLPKLLEGLNRLAKADSMVQVSSDNGQHVIAGAGELHLDICINDLEELSGVTVKRSQPVVAYKESIETESSQVCLAKSGNKHNRIYMTAEALPAELVEDIEEGRVNSVQDVNERARILVDKYGWQKEEAKKIWCFGLEGKGSTMLVDCTKGVQNLGDLKEMIIAGFQWVTTEVRIFEFIYFLFIFLLCLFMLFVCAIDNMGERWKGKSENEKKKGKFVK